VFHISLKTTSRYISAPQQKKNNIVSLSKKLISSFFFKKQRVKRTERILTKKKT